MKHEKLNPVLSKLLEDKEALHWLKRHGPEFTVDSYRGGKLSFNSKVNPDLEVFADKLLTVKDRLPPEYQVIADHYLTNPPRRVAKLLNIPIKDTYRKFERLRQLVAQEYLLYKSEQVGRRTGKASLDSAPVYLCIASRTLEYKGERKHCFLVPYEGDEVWVDADAMIYSEDIQGLLFDLHEHDLGDIDAR